LQFAQTVASTCATAIRNARLFDQFRDRNHHIETMREQAERQTEALKKYQDFFEHAADGIAVIDVDGGIDYVNKEGRRLLGRSWDELRTLKFPALLMAESARLWPELVAQVRHGRFRRSFDVTVRVVAQERVLSLSAGGVGQGTGLLILSFRDVTELRAMESELRTTKEFLENLIDSSVDAIVAADMAGNIILFNKGAEKVYGYKAADVIGVMHVSQMYPEGGADDVMHRLRDERWGGRGRLAPERREIRIASGEVVPVSMSASIIYEDGDESATVGVFTDLRDRMAIERQLSEARDQLTKAEKARVAAELAGMAAHELNQPLTSVLGYAEMLRARVPEGDTRIRRPIETIFQQAERMAEIVRKIGSITKYETKRYGANTDMIDLNRAVDAVPTTDPGERVEVISRVSAERLPEPPPRPQTEPPRLPAELTAASDDDADLEARRSATQSFRVPPEVLSMIAADAAAAAPAATEARDGRRNDPPRSPTAVVSTPPSPRPAKPDAAIGALASLVGPRSSGDAASVLARSAIVRLDTVDEEPAGYARKLLRSQTESTPPTSAAAAPTPSTPPTPIAASTARPTSSTAPTAFALPRFAGPLPGAVSGPSSGASPSAPAGSSAGPSSPSGPPAAASPARPSVPPMTPLATGSPAGNTAAPIPTAAPTFPSRPQPRAIALEDSVAANVEGEEHTNPGVRLSDLRRRGRDEG
jgi:PAS domain S-box-containing protein